MLLNLSDVLSEQHKPLDQMVPVEMETIEIGSQSFPIVDSELAHIQVEHVKDRELYIQVQGKVSVNIPCDRCLEDVRCDIDLDFEKRVDLGRTDAELIEGLDESNFIDGYHLDADQLIFNGVVSEWPMKVLCSDDCKGICSVCGCNLNEGSCDCEDPGLDPRMSVIREVFMNFKEV